MVMMMMLFIVSRPPLDCPVVMAIMSHLSFKLEIPRDVPFPKARVYYEVCSSF